jgi:hypothetical protein
LTHRSVERLRDGGPIKMRAPSSIISTSRWIIETGKIGRQPKWLAGYELFQRNLALEPFCRLSLATVNEAKNI